VPQALGGGLVGVRGVRSKVGLWSGCMGRARRRFPGLCLVGRTTDGRWSSAAPMSRWPTLGDIGVAVIAGYFRSVGAPVVPVARAVQGFLWGESPMVCVHPVRAAWGLVSGCGGLVVFRRGRGGPGAHSGFALVGAAMAVAPVVR